MYGMPFRMVESATTYPYFNEDVEIKWKDQNLNMEIAQAMAKIIDRSSVFLVDNINQFKVHDLRFKKQTGTSLPLIDCSQHSTNKER